MGKKILLFGGLLLLIHFSVRGQCGSTPPTAVVSSVNVTGCNGNSNGSISITSPSGGSGTYQYSNKGGSIWQPVGQFSGLAAGTYNVLIRDPSNPACVIVLNPSLTINQPIPLQAIVTKTNVSQCNGNSNGAIIVNGATGGSGTYQYSNTGGSSWQPVGQFIGLAAGTYMVQIRDASNTTCESTLNTGLVITQPQPLNAQVSSTDASGCNGNSNGSIFFSSPSGGSGTYEYSIDAGSSWAHQNNFLSLTAGTYQVEMRDASNTTCQLILNTNLQISEPQKLSADVNSTDPKCYGDTNGTIVLSDIAGGSNHFEASTDNGKNWLSVKPTFTISNLSAGKYQLLLRDSSNTACFISIGNIALQNPAEILVTDGVIVPACTGSDNGSASVEVSGNPANVIYQWSPSGGDRAAATNLAAGKYSVLVTVQSCSVSHDLSVPEAICTAAEAAENIHLDFYPNPANGELFLQAPGDKADVSITDLSGKEVLRQQNSIQVDVSTLPQGLYFIQLSSEGASIQRKLEIK